MFKILILALAIFASPSLVMAEGNYDKPLLRTNPTQRYMASAMLKLKSNDVTLRLVQAVEEANNKDEATGKFLTRIATEYTDYTVLSNVVAPLQELKNGCDTWL